MKKIHFTALVALLLCFCMLFAFFGCATSEENVENAVKEATSPLNEKIEQLNREIFQKGEENAKLEAEKSTLYDEKTNVEVILNALMVEKSRIEAEVELLQTEMSSLKSDKELLEADKSTLMSDKTALEERIKTLESEIKALKSQIKALDAELADKNEGSLLDLLMSILGKNNNSNASNVGFTINDTLPDGNGKKVKIILLGGQSNASGCSRDEYLKKNVSAEKYAEYASGYDNIYINYFASGTNESKGFVKCSVRQGELGTCFGPELGIADKLNEMYPDETIFIIKYAWGGTNLFEQWLSPSSDGETGPLYNSFVSFVKSSIEYLESKNYDVEIEGMCWMQGESDSFSKKNALNYDTYLTNFIKDIRNRFAPWASDDGIAFVDAYIAANPMYWVYCDLINQSKDNVAAASPMNVLVDTISAGLDCTKEPEGNPDIPHYDSLSEIKLGHLFAEELSKFFD